MAVRAHLPRSKPTHAIRRLLYVHSSTPPIQRTSSRSTRLQDAIKIDQTGGPGKFEVPEWDQASQKKVRDALLILATTMPDFNRAFGTKAEVDPVRHLVASAAAWGGNPDKDATYLNITPEKNYGKTNYKLDVKDVPVEGFWSISLYNSKGYYEKNPYDAYSSTT